MSVIYLELNTQKNVNKGLPVYEKSVTVGAGETSGPIMLEDGAGHRDYWQVAIIPNGGNGRLEFSFSPRETIKTGGGNWVSWGAGNVSSNTSNSLTPVAAVRVVSVVGSITLEVLV